MGSSKNTYSLELEEGAKLTNYVVTEELGELVVTKSTAEIIITAGSQSKTYDGNTLTNDDYSYTEDVLAKGDVLTATVEGHITNVGTVENKITSYKVMRGNKDVTAWYTFGQCVDGVLEITPAMATIVVKSASKTYGDIDPVFEWEVNGLINSTDLGEITVSRISEDADKENVGDDITITANYTVNANYIVTIQKGKLDIIASGDNKVVLTGRQVTYDGMAYGLTDAHAARDGSTLLYSTDNVNFTETAPEFTEAGAHVVYVKATNPNYAETSVEQAKVIINKRDITITADSASKRYDGTDLTANSAKVTAGSVVEGQTWNVTVTGSQRSVGSSKNIAKDAVIKSGDRDVTANYNITYLAGELTVTSSGNSGGGGGNNGGGGGSPSAKPETGGPGAPVTINPDDVPLAIMPDTTPADLTVIDDGEVPFAALPKTGQGSVKGTLTMMMSGILLAIAAINKKRKEEDNS